MMKLTKGGEAVYLHCLPADITDVSCKAGEVSAKVFEKYRDRHLQGGRLQALRDRGHDTPGQGNGPGGDPRPAGEKGEPEERALGKASEEPLVQASRFLTISDCARRERDL